MFIEPKVALLESVQYSLEVVRVVIKNITEEKKGLPISSSKDNIKCLDFDVEKVSLKERPAAKTTPKVVPINPYNKSWLEVMDMV